MTDGLTGDLTRATRKSKTLATLVAHPAVMSVDDDFMEPGTVFVWLNRGWAFDPGSETVEGGHCRGCESPTEGLRAVRHFAQPCACPRCRGETDTRIDFDRLIAAAS